MALTRYIAGIERPGGSVGEAELDWAAIITDVTKLFSGIFKNIGDQVPEFPIRTQETLNKITSEIQAAFPQPESIPQAQALIQEANRWIAEANRKKQTREASAAVMDTYIMILQKVITTYENFIKQQSGAPATDGQPIPNMPGTATDPKIPQPPVNNAAKTALIAGGALVVGALMMNDKKKKVSGIGTNTILLVAAGGAILYFVIKSSSVKQKKQALLQLAASESDQYLAEVINKMTDQEINDTYLLIYYYKANNIEITDAALKQRLALISEKYNIFT